MPPIHFWWVLNVCWCNSTCAFKFTLLMFCLLSQRMKPRVFTANKVISIHTAEFPRSVRLVKGCIPGNPLGTGLVIGLFS